MQFTDILCYMFLTITVTTSCVSADDSKNEIESQPERKITKREATVMVDNFPVDRIYQKPNVIYRRLSKQRYGPPKSKYGPPRQKHRPPKLTRKPGKSRKTKPKTKPTSIPNYGLLSSKKHGAHKSKSKYGVPNTKPGKAGFGHVVKMPHYSFFSHDDTGFGEPPVPETVNYHIQNHKQSYGEPPVDSYGAPLKAKIKDVYPAPHSFRETNNFDSLDFNEYQSWNSNKEQDTNYAFSKHQPKFTLPIKSVFVTPEPNDEEPSHPTAYDKQVKDDKYFFRKRRPQFFSDNAKIVKRPWRPNKHVEFNDEIIVGGQYAEPPARVVPKAGDNTAIYEEEEDPMFAMNGFDEALTAHQHSAYSNYKNSNMAFSPQNLNDAFSIVD